MLSKDYRVPREIDERDLVFDARPKTAVEAAEQAIQDMKEIPEPIYQYDRSHQNVPEHERYGPPTGIVYCEPSPIDRIAELMRDLTYGEMVHLADEIWAAGNGEITAQNLPQILWNWAVSP